MFCALLLLLIVIILVLLKLKYDNRDVSYKGTFYHRHGRLSQFLLHKWSTMEEPFKPTFWATSGYAQTMLHLLWPKCYARWRREYLMLEDQGVVALDWVITENKCSLNSASPVLVIIPGLTCGVHEVTPLCQQAQKWSFRCVVFNWRGHGDSVLTTACLQNSCGGKDVEEAVSFIHSTYPYAKIVVVAYSAGASVLLSYLDEARKSPLSGAVCISPCYEMDSGLDRNLPSVYEYVMLKRLLRLLKQHPGLSSVIDYELALQSATLREFNERVYEPLMGMNGFRCNFDNRVNDYFSSIARLRVPTLCISALDDPICNPDCIPYSVFKNSSNVFLMTCEKGGHCGFYQGDNGSHSWADEMACAFLDAMIHFNLRKTAENSGSSVFAQVTRDRSYTQ